MRKKCKPRRDFLAKSKLPKKIKKKLREILNQKNKTGNRRKVGKSKKSEKNQKIAEK